MFIDSHAHLTSDAVYPQIEECLARAKETGVDHIFNICTDIKTLERGLKLSKKYPWVYNIASTTPHDVEKEGELVFPFVEEQAKKGSLIAIGETGLDYFYEHSKKEIQQTFLRKYLRLAIEVNLPVVIHCRDAFVDLLHILDEEYKGKRGVLHCFTGSKSDAKELLKRGWLISFSGIITFKRSQELREVVKEVPLDEMLIETDTPYLAPQSKRGKQNEPSFIIETAQMIADIKRVSLEEVATATTLNARQLFKI